jgi:gamma-glutamyl phosphate reductase
LSESKTTLARQELEKLHQSLVAMAETVDQQHRAIVNANQGDMVQSYNVLLRLLTQAKLNIDSLARGLEYQ